MGRGNGRSADVGGIQLVQRLEVADDGESCSLIGATSTSDNFSLLRKPICRTWSTLILFD